MKRNPLVRVTLVALGVSLLSCLSPPSLGAPARWISFPASSPPPPDHPVIARIVFDTSEQLQALAADLDIWEVHHDEGYMVALIHPEQYISLMSSGHRPQIDEQRSVHPSSIPDYPCYRTIDELYADLQQLVADHPNIAQLIDIGDSYEGQDIWALRIANPVTVGPKPILFLMANIHGRELITPETAMVFADYLTDGYSTDPDATWLVNHHEIHILVSANPDGHVKNEGGEPWAWWRKNTNPENGCAGGPYGVDLNRNHSFRWGCCDGSSGNSCDPTYRGSSAASEVETQAVQAYVREMFPDQRGPGDDDAAPADATGVLITLHSYSNLVLWPWGWTGDPAPNRAGLEALGRKLASYNGYVPQQASDLYPTDGTTDDWSYGELGIASYTFEIGSSSDGFYPPCSRYDALIQPNIPAFLYAAKVARTPYLTARGPDALSVTATPTGTLDGSIHLTASIDDDDNGGDEIVQAEYYIDKPPWAGGTAVSMEASDGAFDESIESVEASVPTSGWSSGRHIIFVRGQDVLGYWGPPSAVFVTVQGEASTDLSIGKTSSMDVVRPLDQITYTLALTNNSAISLTGLMVTDALPSGLEAVAASPTATLDGELVHWSGLSMPHTSTLTLTLVTEVGSSIAGGTLIQNVDYGAWADQMAGPLMGTTPVETLVTKTYDVDVSPPAGRLSGQAGSLLTHTLQVTNVGNTTDTFHLDASSHTWPTTLEPKLGPLGLGESADATVRVSVPMGTAVGDTDQVTITVASHGDSIKSASAILTTEVIDDRWEIYLPIVLSGDLLP